MKALVGAFNQEKALVGAFSVIVQLHRLIHLRHYRVLERLPRIEAGWRLGVTGELVVSIQVCIKLIVKLRFHLR